MMSRDDSPYPIFQKYTYAWISEVTGLSKCYICRVATKHEKLTKQFMAVCCLALDESPESLYGIIPARPRLPMGRNLIFLKYRASWLASTLGYSSQHISRLAHDKFSLTPIFMDRCSCAIGEPVEYLFNLEKYNGRSSLLKEISDLGFKLFYGKGETVKLTNEEKEKLIVEFNKDFRRSPTVLERRELFKEERRLKIRKEWGRWA